MKSCSSVRAKVRERRREGGGNGNRRKKVLDKEIEIERISVR